MKKAWIFLLLTALCFSCFASCNLFAGDKTDESSINESASSVESTEAPTKETTGGGSNAPASRPGAGNSTTTEAPTDTEADSNTPGSTPPAGDPTENFSPDDNGLPPIWLDLE